MLSFIFGGGNYKVPMPGHHLLRDKSIKTEEDIDAAIDRVHEHDLDTRFAGAGDQRYGPFLNYLRHSNYRELKEKLLRKIKRRAQREVEAAEHAAYWEKVLRETEEGDRWESPYAPRSASVRAMPTPTASIAGSSRPAGSSMTATMPDQRALSNAASTRPRSESRARVPSVYEGHPAASSQRSAYRDGRSHASSSRRTACRDGASRASSSRRSAYKDDASRASSSRRTAYKDGASHASSSRRSAYEDDTSCTSRSRGRLAMKSVSQLEKDEDELGDILSNLSHMIPSRHGAGTPKARSQRSRIAPSVRRGQAASSKTPIIDEEDCDESVISSDESVGEHSVAPAISRASTNAPRR